MEKKHFGNNKYVKLGGLGKWREYYAKLLCDVPINSLLEIGSGTPDFLAKFETVPIKVAIDLNQELNSLYAKKNIKILNVDLETFKVSDLEEPYFDYIICSDVFEHLISPLQALKTCSNLTGKTGCLISHVPNEFQFRHIMSVLFGVKETVAFFESNEWNSPHVRFFSQKGYLLFLEQYFKYNIPLNSKSYSGLKRVLSSLKLLPYTFQSGPTYLSTNDKSKNMFWLKKLKEL